MGEDTDAGDTDAAGLDPAVELARLEETVYSRAGSAETPVERTDPITGETVRATPSEFRLRALRAEHADRAETVATQAVPVGPAPPSRRRRLVLPLVAAGAFAAGIAAALIVIAALAPIDAPGAPVASESAGLLVFDFPPQYPEILVPDLGDQFVADSIRNVSGTSPGKHGFGVYLGRATGSGLYCLIVSAASEPSAVFTCATAEEVAKRGLQVVAAVTVESPVAYNVSDGATEVTAKLSTRGEFSMSFPPPGEASAGHPLPTSLAPPATSGTILGTATNGPDAGGDFQGSFDAHGEGLIIALDCVGEGTVTVDLSDGSSMQFECNSIGVQNLQNSMGIANGTFDLTVFTTGDVVWGLTIASTPVAEPAQG